MVGFNRRFAPLAGILKAKLGGGPLAMIYRVNAGAIPADTWIQDQYFNPHETWHSIDEVLRWFAENGIEYLNCSPEILGTDGETASSLFERTSPGTAYQRAVTQLSWLFTIAREGALFDVIGRRHA